MFNFDLSTLIVHVIVLFVAIPVHEWAHCYVAYVLGDDTAALQGRLTLNPLAHLDPIGSLLILVGGFGWGRPAPVNPYQMTRVRRARTGMLLTALAGPFSNLILAALAALPLRLGVRLGLIDWGVVWASPLASSSASPLVKLLLMFIYINLGLMTFNLLPVPPLDGAKVLAGLVPESLARMLEGLEAYSVYIFILILFVLPALGLDIFSSVAGVLVAIFYLLLFFPL